VRLPVIGDGLRDALEARSGWVTGGGAVALVVATLLYTRFSLQGGLARDESLYVYGGQQLVNHGTPPYASVFDPKSPGATFLAALGIALAKLVGASQLSGARIVFLICSILTVLAIYVLAMLLWRSVVGAVIAAVVFSSFLDFAADALPGPDAKTPAVLFAVVSMCFAARRKWFWAGVFSALGLLVWQPLFGYSIVYGVLALVLGDPLGTSDGDAAPVVRRPKAHWRPFWITVLGVAIPVAITSIYFAAAGAFGKFIEAALVFPLRGAKPKSLTLHERLRLIRQTIITSYQFSGYQFSGYLLIVGYCVLIVLVVLIFVRHGRRVGAAFADPVVGVVALTGVVQCAYAATNFQGGPDVFPLLAPGALGFAGATALVLGWLRRSRLRYAAAVAVLTAAAVLAGFSWVWFENDPQGVLGRQQAQACAIARIVTAQHPLWVMGDTIPLVLTGRTNPDRFAYLGEGVDHWRIKHTQGGFKGWMREIQAAEPWVIVVHKWSGRVMVHTQDYLSHHGYSQRYLGSTRVYLPTDGLRRARVQRVRVTSMPTAYTTQLGGRRMPSSCGLPR
jgi:MFS family permease